MLYLVRMKKISFLSCDKLQGLAKDDEALAEHLRDSGRYSVSVNSWSEKRDWSEFDAVLIRSTWDYHQRIDEFLPAIRRISQQTSLLNSPKIVEWNHHKKYLLELERQGISIVPSLVFTNDELLRLPSHWDQEKFVIKPAISASAASTFIVSRQDIISDKYRSLLHAGHWLCQPFMEVISAGEISLQFFGGEYSHSCIKIPRSGDFRVQEEWGGNTSPYSASERLIEFGKKVLAHLPEKVLYARIDVVPSKESWLLMELELIEPCLFFKTSDSAPAKFLGALEKALL